MTSEKFLKSFISASSRFILFNILSLSLFVLISSNPSRINTLSFSLSFFKWIVLNISHNMSFPCQLIFFKSEANWYTKKSSFFSSKLAIIHVIKVLFPIPGWPKIKSIFLPSLLITYFFNKLYSLSDSFVLNFQI